MGKAVERFRTDAKADGEVATVGRYETFDAKAKPIDKTMVRWFVLQLNREDASGAFAKGDPFRAISVLELLGSLLGIMLLVDGESNDSDHFSGALSVVGITSRRYRY